MTEHPSADNAPRYGVAAANFSEAIYAGRLNGDGSAFSDKETATDMALAAVAQYVARNFDGGMVADFPRLGVVLEVKVRPIEDARIPPVRDAQ